MKSSRNLNILMVLMFIAVISVPLIFVNKTSGKVSTAENRVLASFPAFKSPTGDINLHFIKDFETWFNDNMGLRDRLVMTNTKLQYVVFGELTKKDTIIGENNWLYYVTPDIIKDFQHLNLPSNADLKAWGDSLEEINGYLINKKIPFLTMFNLDKKTIYPENYPKTINKVGNVSRTNMLKQYIEGNTSLDFFTPEKALIAAKSKATVYSPRYDNAHWNKYGAFIGYLELMDRVKKYLPTVNVLSWNDFTIEKYYRETKVYNSVPFSEEDYDLKYNKVPTAIQTNNDIFDELNLGNSIVTYSYKNLNKNLPKALILGDSYFYGFLIPELAESFSELTFIHADNLDKIQNLVELVNPDVVIFENVERMWDHSMYILQNSKESLVDYSEYKNLPKVENPTGWIDYINNQPIKEQGKAKLSEDSKITNIVGWALDKTNETVAGGIYLKVGEKYYSGNYGIARESVSSAYNNINLTNSGYSFNVPTEELKKAGEFSLIVISNDKTYQYSPMNVSIEN